MDESKEALLAKLGIFLATTSHKAKNGLSDSIEEDIDRFLVEIQSDISKQDLEVVKAWFATTDEMLTNIKKVYLKGND